jgi:glycosyltransferase involved in cell wall biosynthesis
MEIKVCFIGGTRYSQPLDATSEKKFRALKSLGELFVIGYSQNVRPRRFTEHAHFCLLPRLPLSFLRYVEMFVIGPLLVCSLILWHGVQIVVTQSPYEGFVGALAKKITAWLGYRVSLVVEVHGDFERTLFLQRRVLAAGLYRFVMHRVARFSLRQAYLLRAVSESTKQQLEQWVPGKPVVQFPTWTDIEVFLQADILQERDSFQSILYAGVLTPLKGVHHLLNAFVSVAKEFPQARLVIAGHEENKSYAAELKEQVKRLGLDRRVQFVGALRQRELAVWMRKASVFVLPSASEGLPRVVLEAMASRTPVIGSNVSGIPEIVQDGATGFLVQPGDEKQLTDKLRWVLENPDKAREMGHHARAFAERFFSTQMYVDGYRQIFEVAQALFTEDSEHAPSTL